MSGKHCRLHGGRTSSACLRKERIGGGLPVYAELFAQPPVSAPAPGFGRSSEIWLDSGRSALAAALEAIKGKGTTGRAWLPAYVCGSVVSAFGSKGFAIDYYPVEQSLSMCGYPPVGAGDVFFFIHYFGMKNTSALEFLRGSRD